PGLSGGQRAGRRHRLAGRRRQRGPAPVPGLPHPVRGDVGAAPIGRRGRRRAREEEALMLLGPSLALSAILFVLGVAGVLIRRNAIVVFMCVELMLNAVNLSFIALSQLHGVSGQIMVFFVMTVAAAEAAVGLAIILAIFRHTQSVDLTQINLLRG